MISVRNLGKLFPNGYVALEDCSMEVEEGEVVTIIGPSGCGKSTVLNCVAGLDRPSEGSVSVMGEPVTGPSEGASYMFQQTTLLPWRTVEDNIGLALEIRGTPRKEARSRAGDWVARVGLEGFEKAYLYQISGGMQKRVELGQCLIRDPAILLMDEPFAALDALTRYRMQQEVTTLCEDMGKTMLFVTHDLDEAIAISDRVVLMTAGPRSHIRDEFRIDLPRPRELASVRMSEEAATHQRVMWKLLEAELERSEGE